MRAVLPLPGGVEAFRQYWESLHDQPGKLISVTNANERQIGGSHYKQADGSEEHWDRVARLRLDYFQGQITKYTERCWDKNGIEDLEKARHFLDKYIEVSKAQGRKSMKQMADPSTYILDPSKWPSGPDKVDPGVYDAGTPFEKTPRNPFLGTPFEKSYEREMRERQQQAAELLSAGAEEAERAFLQRHAAVDKDELTIRRRGNHISRSAGERKPDGWWGYTHEGTDADGARFRCKACREHFFIPPNGNPNDHHYCEVNGPLPAEPTPAYVNQDGPEPDPVKYPDGPPAIGG